MLCATHARVTSFDEQGESLRVVLPPGVSPGQSFTPIRPIDYKALRLLTERSIDGSRLKKDQQLRQFDKAWRQGKLGYPAETPPDWKRRMCEARMMMNDFSDWSGWEYRSEWSTGRWHNAGNTARKKNGEIVEQVPAWDGSYVEILHIPGEQGVGDEVCFSQSLLKIKKAVGLIVLETDKRLCPVFERSLGIKCMPSHQAVEEGERVRYFRDVKRPWLPLGDVLRNVYRHPSHFARKPFLTALPEEVEKYSKYKGRVGISWRGQHGNYPVSELLKIYPNALGLQYDLAWDEEVEQADLDLRDDFEGIFGLLMNLERLVTVSTSIAHFAAALGVKTDVIMAPMNGLKQNILNFKWGLGGKTCWYPDTVTVYPNLKSYLAHL